jgi:maltooligosyltrehalose trehalohydrolase
MARDGDGQFELHVPDAEAGADYSFVVPERGDRPDPVSRHQPQGVFGPSRVVDPDAFAWTDGDWRGLPLGDLIVYELHVGTFTAQGTFAAVSEKLRYLKELGITAIQLMPVVEFPGARNWGYDGVDLYAPHSAYGGPTALKQLIDDCHRLGLAVLVDVVYNHLGPDGNFLGDYGPYFTHRYSTPWGDAVNFDGPHSEEVRRYFIDNALMWLTEYHADGLRLDAVHGIFDLGARHILEELKYNFTIQAEVLGRQAHVIAESDLNDTRLIRARATGGYQLDAQWSDDFHHAVFTILTGTRRGYFADFGAVDDLRKAIAEGFVYDGRHSGFRRRRHGNSAAELPGHKLVVYVQNHDQIANGSQGQRLGHLVSPEVERVAAALLFTAPGVPLLFMGQEFASGAPFFYFTSHTDPALAETIRKGRRDEFAHFTDGTDGSEPPSAWADPQSQEAFVRSKLDWDNLPRGHHAALARYYADLIALRRRTAALANGRKDLTKVWAAEAPRHLVVMRQDPGGSHALVAFNLTASPHEVPIPALPLPLALQLCSGGAPAATLAAGLPGAVALPGWSVAFYTGTGGRPER